MSFESWKKEFYPLEADAAAERSDKKALEHSIQKWKGLTQKNLAKHGGIHLETEDFVIFEGVAKFDIDVETCALCQRYLYHGSELDPCHRCPLYGDGLTCGPEYEQFIDGCDPAPMQRLLATVYADLYPPKAKKKL